MPNKRRNVTIRNIKEDVWYCLRMIAATTDVTIGDAVNDIVPYAIERMAEDKIVPSHLRTMAEYLKKTLDE